MKSIVSIGIASIFVLGGMQAMASPADSANLLAQPDVKLLSAKIENAIAELPEKRSREGIQNAAYFVLAKHSSTLDIKSAAIDNVIDHAHTIGDQEVVEALTKIDLGADDTVEAPTAPKANSVAVTKQAASISPPPSSNSKGGSDY